MGHWLFENKLVFNRKKLWLITMFCVLLVWVVNVFDFNPKIWTQNDCPLIAILAASIFALFISRKWKNTKWLWGVDRLCFGAYLIHPLFIQFTYRFLKVTPVDFCFYPVMTVIFATFLLSWLLRQRGL